MKDSKTHIKEIKRSSEDVRNIKASTQVIRYDHAI